MPAVRRLGVVTGLVLTVMAVWGVPAAGDSGWGSVDCSQNPYPGCELGVGAGPEEVRLPVGGGSGGRELTGGGDGGEEELDHANPDWNRADCAYERADDFAPPPEFVPTSFSPTPDGGSAVVPAAFVGFTGPVVPVAEPEPGEEGAWYVYRCTSDGVRDALYQPPVWLPDFPDAEGDEPGPSAEQLAQQAREQLRLPAPDIAASPEGDQLVSVPTWLWLDPEGWEEISATASVPGVSVAAVATPLSVTWSMGDGSEVVCDGPGTPFGARGAPERPSPDCGHTYGSSSAGQPGEAYPVFVEVSWTVTWAGAGESGEFPGLSTEAATSFRVLESHALN